HRKAQDRARDLERLRRASRRMTTPHEEMAVIAYRIHTECEKVLESDKSPLFWFQFEALAPGSEFKSWWWGPDSEILEEGGPQPRPATPQRAPAAPAAPSGRSSGASCAPGRTPPCSLASASGAIRASSIPRRSSFSTACCRR